MQAECSAVEFPMTIISANYWIIRAGSLDFFSHYPFWGWLASPLRVGKGFLKNEELFQRWGQFFPLAPHLQDLAAAMKMLGLNPMEQEIVDLTNEITRNGFIYFPEFCSIVFKKMREDDEEVKQKQK